ncbi:hypothetical protein [uncultured virus]|uniref:Uncharacterized protein n=1 Tax=uncultured virus TaxID=340016 RepID=A0A218MM83_9VIRU|nr:hypothetical protein [uncultured virus]
MSLRDYEGWRRYSKHKRENKEAYERGLKKQQMSDGLTEAYKGAKYQSHKKIQTVKKHQPNNRYWEEVKDLITF